MEGFRALLFLSLCSFSYTLCPEPVIAEDCNAAELQAGLALEEINKDRDEGYIFTLFRVVDAHSQSKGAGNIYYLTLDVLETECSVLSGKNWQDCKIRPFHETVFGQCKAIVYVDLPLRRIKLYGYNCNLRTVPLGLILSICLDCPALDKDTTSYVPIAESLTEKYNRESNNPNVFKFDYIERASMQWVFDPSYFVEFIIRETNCSRFETNVSDCQFLEDAQANVGFCIGEQTSPNGTDVSVSCDIYNPKGHGHGRGKGQRHHHHPEGQNQTRSEERKRPHNEMHGNGPSNGDPQTDPGQKKHDRSSEHTQLKPACPHLEAPVGSVQTFYLVNETEVFPVPSIPDLSCTMDPPSSPPVPGSTGSGGPAGPGPIGPIEYPEPQPFPVVPSDSKGCPAEPKHDLPEIVSLWPHPK